MEIDWKGVLLMDDMGHVLIPPANGPVSIFTPSNLEHLEPGQEQYSVKLFGRYLGQYYLINERGSAPLGQQSEADLESLLRYELGEPQPSTSTHGATRQGAADSHGNIAIPLTKYPKRQVKRAPPSVEPGLQRLSLR